jgi:hypothetical protein
MNELNHNRETASKIDVKSSLGIETHETTKVARENENNRSQRLNSENKRDMSELSKLANARREELLANGQLRSSAEKFLDEPRMHRAVRRFCYECNGFSNQHATNCENTNCALWLFRHGKTIPREEELPVWQKAHKRWLQSAGELKRE